MIRTIASLPGFTSFIGLLVSSFVLTFGLLGQHTSLKNRGIRLPVPNENRTLPRDH